jgi:hypothetical protein
MEYHRNLLILLGHSREGIALYRPADDEYSKIVLSVGNRFMCGGTENIWRITSIDAKEATVTVVREYPSDQGPFKWHYRSACAGHIPLTHQVYAE